MQQTSRKTMGQQNSKNPSLHSRISFKYHKLVKKGVVFDGCSSELCVEKNHCVEFRRDRNICIIIVKAPSGTYTSTITFEKLHKLIVDGVERIKLAHTHFHVKKLHSLLSSTFKASKKQHQKKSKQINNNNNKNDNNDNDNDNEKKRNKKKISEKMLSDQALTTVFQESFASANSIDFDASFDNIQSQSSLEIAFEDETNTMLKASKNDSLQFEYDEEIEKQAIKQEIAESVTVTVQLS